MTSENDDDYLVLTVTTPKCIQECIDRLKTEQSFRRASGRFIQAVKIQRVQHSDSSVDQILRTPVHLVAPSGGGRKMAKLKQGVESLLQLFIQLASLPLKHMMIIGMPVRADVLAITLRRTRNTLVSLRMFAGYPCGNFEPFARALDNHPSLKLVRFVYRSSFRHDGSCGRLTSSIAGCPKIAIAFLGFNYVRSLDVIKGSLPQLCSSSTLQKLHLPSGLDTAAYVTVFETLQTNTTLRSLSCNGQELEPLATNALLAMLKVNTTIARVVTADRIEDGSRRFLLRSMPRLAEEVQQFTPSLDGNHVVQEMLSLSWMAGDIQFYLNLNRFGRDRLLGSGEATATREDWVNMLITLRDDPNAVRYYLLKNPSVLWQHDQQTTEAHVDNFDEAMGENDQD